MSTPQNNASTPPEESVQDAHSNTLSPGGEQTDTSSPEQASHSLVVEPPSEASSPAAVVSAAQIAPTQPTSSSSDPAAPLSQPESAGEQAAEGSTPADVRPRVVPAILKVPTATYGGRGRGGGDRTRNDVLLPPPLPRRSASVRVTRSDANSDATLDEAVHPPRSVAFPRRDPSHRRSPNHYLDSEAAWHAREPVHKINVDQRLAPTARIVTHELGKASKRGETIAWTQKVALTLQVLVGALITALGAALRGPSTNIAITILGVTSTLVAWYLARTRDSNEPQRSRDRARDLGHLLREVDVFILDHGHEPGDMWEDKINGFRLALEKIFGIETSTDPNSTADSNAGQGRTDSDPNSKGNGNREASAV